MPSRLVRYLSCTRRSMGHLLSRLPAAFLKRHLLAVKLLVLRSHALVCTTLGRGCGHAHIRGTHAMCCAARPWGVDAARSRTVTVSNGRSAHDRPRHVSHGTAWPVIRRWSYRTALQARNRVGILNFALSCP